MNKTGGKNGDSVDRVVLVVMDAPKKERREMKRSIFSYGSFGDESHPVTKMQRKSIPLIQAFNGLLWRWTAHRSNRKEHKGKENNESGFDEEAEIKAAITAAFAEYGLHPSGEWQTQEPDVSIGVVKKRGREMNNVK